MWTVSQIICLGTLMGTSVTDIHYHKVPADILLMGNIGVVLYQIYKACRGEADVWLIAGGAAVGFLFLLLSKVTREGIGYGDSWGILVLGIYLGFWKILEVLAGAFSVLGIVSLVALCVKKMSRKYGIPFFPFLTIGYFMSLIVK